MTLSSYAEEADLTAFLATGTTVTDGARLLARASELLDDKVTAAFSTDDGTGLPTDADVAAAMRDACCAQVEFWLDLGEEHDIEGMAGRQVSIQSLSIAALPPELAPRAARLLRGAGLMGTGVDATAAAAFFTPNGTCC